MAKYVIGETCVCGRELEPKVLHSQAGYYVGYWCPDCGPLDRISKYYKRHDQAENLLEGYEEVEE